MRVLSILLKFSHHASAKSGRINARTVLCLVGSAAFQGVLTIYHCLYHETLGFRWDKLGKELLLNMPTL